MIVIVASCYMHKELKCYVTETVKEVIVLCSNAGSVLEEVPWKQLNVHMVFIV